MDRFSLRACEEKFPEVLEVARRHVHDWRTSGATEPEDVLLRAALHRIVDNSSPAVTFAVIDRMLHPKEQAGAAPTEERKAPMPETLNHQVDHRLENVGNESELHALESAGYFDESLDTEAARLTFETVMDRLRTPTDELRAERRAAGAVPMTEEQRGRLRDHFRGDIEFCDCASEADYRRKLAKKS